MSIRGTTTAGGQSRFFLTHPSGATAELHLAGAHLTSWIPAGQGEAIFLSRAASFRPGDAIRGGIPVVFPQFSGLGPLPKHGFARTAVWEPEPVPDDDVAGDVVALTLRLRDSAATRALWPHAFLARLTVELAGDALALRFVVENTGPAPFEFTAALHTYLRVADIARAGLYGLHGVHFRDALDGGREREQAERILRVAGPVDRVYPDAPHELLLHDEAAGRSVRLRQDGFRDVVVWNPWSAGADALVDMDPHEYRVMLCVEAAQAATPVTLPPGGRWTGAQRLRVE
jgi:glucose-6-phosphate 1-epimerase